MSGSFFFGSPIKVIGTVSLKFTDNTEEDASTPC